MINDTPSSIDQEWAESLQHVQCSEKIEIEELLGLLEWAVQSRYGKPTTSIVDQNVEFAGFLADLVGSGSDGLGGSDVQSEHCNVRS